MPADPERPSRMASPLEQEDKDSQCLGTSPVSGSSRETLLCDSDDEFDSSLRTSSKERDAATDPFQDMDMCPAAEVKFSRIFAKQRVYPHSTLPISTGVESTAPSCAIAAETLIIDGSDADEPRCYTASVSATSKALGERRRWRACLKCNKLFNFNKVVSGTLEMHPRGDRTYDVPKGMCDQCLCERASNSGMCLGEADAAASCPHDDSGLGFLSIAAADVNSKRVLPSFAIVRGGELEPKESARAQEHDGSVTDRFHSGCFRSMRAMLLHRGETRFAKMTQGASARGRSQRIQPTRATPSLCAH